MIDTLLHLGERKPNKLVGENKLLEDAAVGLHVVALTKYLAVAIALLVAILAHNLLEELRNGVDALDQIHLRLANARPRTVGIGLVDLLGARFGRQLQLFPWLLDEVIQWYGDDIINGYNLEQTTQGSSSVACFWGERAPWTTYYFDDSHQEGNTYVGAHRAGGGDGEGRRRSCTRN